MKDKKTAWISVSRLGKRVNTSTRHPINDEERARSWRGTGPERYERRVLLQDTVGEEAKQASFRTRPERHRNAVTPDPDLGENRTAVNHLRGTVCAACDHVPEFNQDCRPAVHRFRRLGCVRTR